MTVYVVVVEDEDERGSVMAVTTDLAAARLAAGEFSPGRLTAYVEKWDAATNEQDTDWEDI